MNYFTWRYWLHITFIATAVLGLLQLFFGGDMFSFRNVLVSVPLLGLADIVGDFIFKLN